MRSSDQASSGGSTRQRRPAPPSLWTLHVMMVVLSAAFVAPLIIVISASFSSESALNANGYSLFPQEFTTTAYSYLLGNPQQLIRSYLVSILVTTLGTAMSLTVMSMLAYAISRSDFRLRRLFSLLVLFAMLFSGGLVPTYILITRYYGLQNNLWVLILPYLVAPWYVLLLRTFFMGLPAELTDAAMVDGAGAVRMFISIVLPLSKPALGAVGLFMLLLYWNDWWLGLLYIRDTALTPVQLLLYRIDSNIEFLLSTAQFDGLHGGNLPVQSLRAAVAVLAVGPIILAFFFMQRFLVKGITLGGVKE